MIKILIICGILLGFFAIVVGLANYLPFIKEKFGKLLFLMSLTAILFGLVVISFLMGFTDPIVLRVFEMLGIANEGLFDSNVQFIGFWLSIILAAPFLLLFFCIKAAKKAWESDTDYRKFNVWSCLVLSLLSAICAISAALLA